VVGTESKKKVPVRQISLEPKLIYTCTHARTHTHTHTDREKQESFGVVK